MLRLCCAVLVVSLASSCLVVPEGAKPGFGAKTELASQYNFRGMPNNDTGVLQAEMQVDLPTKLETANLSFKTFANFDLRDDVGDAWFPDGHGGEPSEIDLQAAYSETYHGLDITTGLISYALQNPDDFPFAAERGETKAVFVHIEREVPWQLVPALEVFYDIDEVEGWYGNVSVSRDFPIKDKLDVDARVALGYSDGDQSEWDYGLNASGWSDLSARGRITYALDSNTLVYSSVNASTILDDDLQDWFDLLGIESDNVWAAIGVEWSY